MKKQTMGPTVGDEMVPPGVQATLSAIGGKWKIPILWLLWRRMRRFGELKRALPGVTQHMLTTSLRELETAGLVSRTVYAEVPPRVEYALTGHASRLCDVFMAMEEWGRAFSPGDTCTFRAATTTEAAVDR